MIIVVVKSPESNGVIISTGGKTIDWKVGGNTASWIDLQNIVTTIFSDFEMQFKLRQSDIKIYEIIISHHHHNH